MRHIFFKLFAMIDDIFNVRVNVLKLKANRSSKILYWALVE